MNLSVLLILFFAILALFPLISNMRTNILFCASFILSLAINYGFFYFLKTIKFFNVFNNIYDSCTYFTSLRVSRNDCLSIFNFLFMFGLFLIMWVLIFLLFRILFKDKAFIIQKSLARIITVSIFRVINCFCLLCMLFVFLTSVNQFWEFKTGFLGNIFNLVLDLVCKL